MSRLERKNLNKAFAQLVLAVTLVTGFAHGSLAAETVQISAVVGNPQEENQSGSQGGGFFSGGFIGRIIDQLFPPQTPEREESPMKPIVPPAPDRPSDTATPDTSKPDGEADGMPRPILLGPGRMPMDSRERHALGLALFIAGAILLALTLIGNVIRRKYERTK